MVSGVNCEIGGSGTCRHCNGVCVGLFYLCMYVYISVSMSGYSLSHSLSLSASYLVSHCRSVSLSVYCSRMQWDSDWGPVVCCRTGPGAPSIPRSIRATEVGSNSILLAWVLPDKDNGLPVTDYVVRYKEWIDPTKPKVDHSKNQSRDKQRHEEDEDAFYNTGGYGDDPGDGSAEEVYVDVDKYQNASELAAEAADRKWGTEVYRDKPRFFLMAGLKPSTVYMFKVCAVNLAGEGEFTHKVCVRTLVEGATDVTPWVMAIDQKTHQAFYMHPRTQAVTWTLPPGVLIDQPESFK